jgi:hypothetical protein
MRACAPASGDAEDGALDDVVGAIDESGGTDDRLDSQIARPATTSTTTKTAAPASTIGLRSRPTGLGVTVTGASKRLAHVPSSRVRVRSVDVDGPETRKGPVSSSAASWN